MRLHPLLLKEYDPPIEDNDKNSSIAVASTSTLLVNIREEHNYGDDGEAIPGPSGLQEGSGVSNMQSQPNTQPNPKRPRQLKLFGSRDTLSDSTISRIDEKLVKLITLDYQPLSIVEDQGFLEFTKELQPLYKVPGRKKVIRSDLS